MTKAKIKVPDRACAVAAKLLENAARIRFGEVAAILRVHNGRVVSVSHTVTENTREQGEVIA